LNPIQIPAIPPIVENIIEDIENILPPQIAGTILPIVDPTIAPTQIKALEFME